MATVLVVDDDANILTSFEFLFPDRRHQVVTANSCSRAFQLLDQIQPDVIFVDVHMPDSVGLDLVRKLQEREKKVPIIVMTGFGTAESAIEAMRLGAFEYILKPFDPDQIETLVERAIEVGKLMRVPMRFENESNQSPTSETMIGRSPAMQEVFKSIGRVAPLDVAVLILGESGTGKEMVARAIYHHSKRCDERFLAVNCAAIPENLLESELFGHEKGAFTGAERRRPGKFEQCHGGTLFLDEIGDMSPVMQAKVLRVLQSQEFERVGGVETIRTDVRIIAATNRNLEKMIAENAFRQDLYYRLDVCSIHLPPLRERKEDIRLFVDHFIRTHSEELKKDVRGISEEAASLLQEYHWPGNVRELQSVIKQAIVKSTGPVLLPEFFPAIIRKGDRSRESQLPDSQAVASIRNMIRERLNTDSENLYADVIGAVERQLLVDVMTHTKGNLSKASRILGISRPTLRAKLATLGHVKVQETDDEAAADL